MDEDIRDIIQNLTCDHWTRDALGEFLDLAGDELAKQDKEIKALKQRLMKAMYWKKSLKRWEGSDE